MALMRVRRLAQLTLPAEVRRALNVREGDYLDAEIVDGGVFLRPVAVVDRAEGWQTIRRVMDRVADRKADRRASPAVREREIAKLVNGRRRPKHVEGGG